MVGITGGFELFRGGLRPLTLPFIGQLQAPSIWADQNIEAVAVVLHLRASIGFYLPASAGLFLRNLTAASRIFVSAAFAHRHQRSSAPPADFGKGVHILTQIGRQTPMPNPSPG